MNNVQTNWTPAGQCDFCGAYATKEEPLFVLCCRDRPCASFCRRCLLRFHREVVLPALRDALPNTPHPTP